MSQDKPRAIKTNGIGRATRGHLNLTRTLAGTDTAPPLTTAQQAVVDGYASRTPTKQIAEEAGISPKSVKVIACRLGVKRPAPLPQPVVPRRPPFAGYDRYERGW